MATRARSKDASGAIKPAKAAALTDLVAYAEGSIVSRTIVDKKEGTLTLFAFDEGQGLSEHTAPFDAYAVILDGQATPVIKGKAVPARTGEIVLMPAGVPHAIRGGGRFKMLLVMVRA